MSDFIKFEYKRLLSFLKNLDKKVLVIFLSVVILQTISWYFTSRKFFSDNLYYFFDDRSKARLFEFLYWFAGDFILLFCLPVLIIKFFFKEKLKNYGLNFKNSKIGLWTAGLFVFLMAVMVWFVSASDNFARLYPLFSLNSNSIFLMPYFSLYLIGLFLYLFAWEFIWRGFMLFGLEEKFGDYSVFIQAVPFVILHNGKPVVETFGAIAAALLLGYLALRTRSLLYGFISHFCVMLSIEVISILRFKANNYGTGFSSFLLIIEELFN